MDISLARHALVTGGASGIGLGIVRALANRSIAVTVVDIDNEALEAEIAPQHERLLPLKLDTRDRTAWQEAKRAAEKQFGPVDILVNNAGIGPDGHEFADMDPDAFDRMVAINLTAVFNGIHAFAGDMRSRRKGYIVNTSSVMGLCQGLATRGAYSATKFGVVGLSEALRAELAPHGVGVSVLCPGPVSSNMARTTRAIGNDFPAQSRPAGIIGMTGDDAGRIVVRGIELDLPYILTHPEHATAIAQRNAAIQASALAATREWGG